MRVWDSEGGRSLWYCMCVFLLVFCSLGFYRPLLPASALLLYITSNKSLAVNLLQQTKMRVFIRHRPLTGTLVSIFIFFLQKSTQKSHQGSWIFPCAHVMACLQFWFTDDKEIYLSLSHCGLTDNPSEWLRIESDKKAQIFWKLACFHWA